MPHHIGAVDQLFKAQIGFFQGILRAKDTAHVRASVNKAAFQLQIFQHAGIDAAKGAGAAFSGHVGGREGQIGDGTVIF